MIKIILADDHAIVRNGIRNLLEKEPAIQIIGEAVNGQEIIQMLEANTADIVLTDMNMPMISGVEVAAKLKEAGSPVKVILLTMHSEQPYINSAFRAGACAYLFKNIAAEELLFAIKHVYNGKKYLSNDLSLRLLDQAMNAPVHAEYNSDDINFSDRELNILKLIAEGYTNEEIADKIYTSKRTVEGHRLIMINKTGVRNTAALIKFVLQHGII